MRSRIAALVVVVAVAGALFAVQGAQVAGADEHDPIGYTIGTKLPAGLGGGTCDFYKIDLETGAATPVNPVSQPVLCGDGLTFDEDGTLYAIGTVRSPAAWPAPPSSSRSTSTPARSTSSARSRTSSSAGVG